LPAATVVSAYTPRASREHCFLDRFQMTVWNIEAQLVQIITSNPENMRPSRGAPCFWVELLGRIAG